MSHCHFSVRNDYFFFFLITEKVILYNILLLLFGGLLQVGGLRRWPKWPIASAGPAQNQPYIKDMNHVHLYMEI